MAFVTTGFCINGQTVSAVLRFYWYFFSRSSKKGHKNGLQVLAGVWFSPSFTEH